MPLTWLMLSEGRCNLNKIMFSYVVLQSATFKSAFAMLQACFTFFFFFLFVSVMDALPSAKWYKPLFNDQPSIV